MSTTEARHYLLVITATVILVAPASVAWGQSLNRCLQECRRLSPQSQCGVAKQVAPQSKPGPKPDRYVERKSTVHASGKSESFLAVAASEDEARRRAKDNAAEQCRNRGGRLGRQIFGGMMSCDRTDKGNARSCRLDSAKYECLERERNPAYERWKQRKRAYDKQRRQQQQIDSKHASCVRRAEGDVDDCRRRCRRQAGAASNETNNRRSNASDNGRTSTGRNGSSTTSNPNSSGTRPQGGNSYGGNSTSSSSSSSSSSSGDSAATAGGTTAGGGAVYLLYEAIFGGDEDEDSSMSVAERRAVFEEGENEWVPWVGTIVLNGVGLSAFLLLDFINENQLQQSGDRVDPVDMPQASVWLGPDGVDSWWSRFAWRFETGYNSYDYDGYFITYDEYGSPAPLQGRGIPVRTTFRGMYTGMTARYGVFRGSLGYLGLYGDATAGTEEQVRDSDWAVSETVAMHGISWSLGLQVFQGLFQPYVEYRRLDVLPLHRTGAFVDEQYGHEEKDTTLYVPPSGGLVFGNTLDLSGSRTSDGPLRRAFIVDTSLGTALHGPFDGGFRITMGYTVSWF